jgi:hypothetical protein
MASFLSLVPSSTLLSVLPSQFWNRRGYDRMADEPVPHNQTSGDDESMASTQDKPMNHDQSFLSIFKFMKLKGKDPDWLAHRSRNATQSRIYGLPYELLLEIIDHIDDGADMYFLRQTAFIFLLVLPRNDVLRTARNEIKFHATTRDIRQMPLFAPIFPYRWHGRYQRVAMWPCSEMQILPFHLPLGYISWRPRVPTKANAV